jgi:hypothetical protein
MYDAARDRLIYDRSLKPGPGSTLYGLEVARAMHLPVAFLEKAHAYRRRLLGTVSEAEAETSSWNSAVTRRCCEVCNHEIVRDLEVHHIRPRAEAQGARFADGSARDDLRNLVVVCQACHDAHHAGQIEIGPIQQTSSGPERRLVIPNTTRKSALLIPSDESTDTSSQSSNESPQQQAKPTNIFEKFAFNPKKTKDEVVIAKTEEMQTILQVMKTYPALSIRQLVPKLRNDYEINVEESVLRKIKKTGAV